MEIKRDSLTPASYIFNPVNDISVSKYVFINSIGCEYRKQTDEEPYVWDCRVPEGSEPGELTCIFQYTVSGEGIISINNKNHKLTAGSIFMIERPGPYKYWLPETSDHWELKFIEFSSAAQPLCNSITQSFGRVFSMNESSPVIKLWNKLYGKTQNNEITNVYDNSLYAYTFLLNLHKYLAQFNARTKNSEFIQRCKDYITENFTKNITISDIAQAGGISPFYLNKEFKSVVGDTPMNYVVKMRIRHGMGLLYNSDLTIDEIAKMSGFQNANYFAKVFKKYVDKSPTEFRNLHMTPIIL